MDFLAWLTIWKKKATNEYYNGSDGITEKKKYVENFTNNRKTSEALFTSKRNKSFREKMW